MALIPIGMDHGIDFKTSSDYSTYSLNHHKQTVQEDEGLADLEAVIARKGINPNDGFSFYVWEALEDWFKESMHEGRTLDFVRRFINIKHPTNALGDPLSYDRTVINHIVNRFVFLGLLFKVKGERCDYFYFELFIKKKGIDWFRKDNKYLKGLFQSEQGFNLMEENK